MGTAVLQTPLCVLNLPGVKLCTDVFYAVFLCFGVLLRVLSHKSTVSLIETVLFLFEPETL